MQLDKSVAELAREHMQMRHNAKMKRANRRTKQGTCSMCGGIWEGPEEENGPKYCWRCSDKHDIGGPWD